MQDIEPQTALPLPKVGFRISKYVLKQGHGAVTRIQASPRTNIVALMAQGDNVCLWAETVMNGQPWEWVVKCVATGEEVPTDEVAVWRHIGSVLVAPSATVWHYYMREGILE